MSRRAGILALCAVLVACRTGTAQSTITTAVGSRIERLDPALDALIDRNARVEKLADGFAWTEGPVWRRDKGYLLFSDIPHNTVWKWNQAEGLSIYMRPAGYAFGTNPPGRELGTNGLTFDKSGTLVVADHGNRGISRWNDSLFTRTVVVDRFEGKRFNSPNDLVYAKDGSLYFTDPPYGLAKQDEDPAKEMAFNGVYRFADGRVQALVRDLNRPNGLAFSPDAKILYVNNSDAAKNLIMRYDVAADGTLANGRVFADLTSKVDGLADGLKVDAKGNIYTSGPGGVWVLSPDGKHLGTIQPPEVPANCGWGDDGKTLYMTAVTGIYRVRTLVGQK